MTRLLITGGAGFIGSYLARRAAAEHVEVTVLDDLSSGRAANLEGVDVTFVRGSVLDDSALDRALAGVDCVVHLAAVADVLSSIADPLRSHTVNATGTVMVLEACRRHDITQVVGASSSAVYGSNPASPKRERDWVRPLSPYGVSKLATEQYLLAYQSCYGLSTLALRFFNVYGPGQAAGHAYAAVIPAFVDALLAGRPLQVNGDGSQTRDFIYVGTVCEVLLEASLRRLSHPEPVNLAFSTRTDLLTLIEQLERVTGLHAAVAHRPAQVGDIAHSQADHAALRELFPTVTPVPLTTGLQETVSWFKQQQSMAT